MTAKESSSNARFTVPTIVVWIFVGVAWGIPVVYSPVSTQGRLLQWLLWIAAAGAVLYLAVSAWRVYREHGLGAVIRWVVTGSLPRR